MSEVPLYQTRHKNHRSRNTKDETLDTYLNNFLIQSQRPGTKPDIQFKDKCFSKMLSGSEEVSYSRLIDLCITEL